jgi:hypothetical protein
MEIVDLPNFKMVVFHMLVYQRVYGAPSHPMKHWESKDMGKNIELNMD